MADNPSYDKLQKVVADALTEIRQSPVHPNSPVAKAMMDAIWPVVDDMLNEAWGEGYNDS